MRARGVGVFDGGEGESSLDAVVRGFDRVAEKGDIRP
jgi:hypothetical protein